MGFNYSVIGQYIIDTIPKFVNNLLKNRTWKPVSLSLPVLVKIMFLIRKEISPTDEAKVVLDQLYVPVDTHVCIHTDTSRSQERVC